MYSFVARAESLQATVALSHCSLFRRRMCAALEAASCATPLVELHLPAGVGAKSVFRSVKVSKTLVHSERFLQEYLTVADYCYMLETGKRMPYDAPRCTTPMLDEDDASSVDDEFSDGQLLHLQWRRTQCHEDMHLYSEELPIRPPNVRNDFASLVCDMLSVYGRALRVCRFQPPQVPTLYVPNVSLSSEALRQIEDAVRTSARARGTTELCMAAGGIAALAEHDPPDAHGMSNLVRACVESGVTSLCLRKAEHWAFEGLTRYLASQRRGDGLTSLSVECTIFNSVSLWDTTELWSKFWREIGANRSLKRLTLGNVEQDALFSGYVARALSANRTLEVIRFSTWSETTDGERGRLIRALVGLLRDNDVLRCLDLPSNLALSGETLRAVARELRAGGGAALQTLTLGSSPDHLSVSLRELRGGAELPLRNIVLSARTVEQDDPGATADAMRSVAEAVDTAVASCGDLQSLVMNMYDFFPEGEVRMCRELPVALAGAGALRTLELRGAGEFDKRLCVDTGRALQRMHALRELILVECSIADFGVIVDSLPSNIHVLHVEGCDRPAPEHGCATLAALLHSLEQRTRRGCARPIAAFENLYLDFSKEDVLDGSSVATLEEMLSGCSALCGLALLCASVDEACEAQYAECVARQTVTGSLSSVTLVPVTAQAHTVFAAMLRSHPLQTRLEELWLSGEYSRSACRWGDDIRRAVSDVEAAREQSTEHLRAWLVVRDQIQRIKEREAREGRRYSSLLGSFRHVPFRAVSVITHCVGLEYAGGVLLML